MKNVIRGVPEDGASQPDIQQLVSRARNLVEPNLVSRFARGVKALTFHAGLHPAFGQPTRGDAVILYYHKVQRHPVGVWGEPVLDVHEFERQVAWLDREYRPISLSELVAGLQGRARLPSRAVALTFDDGYRNNLVLAAPVLARQGVPATFFLTTGLVGTDRWMWAYELEELFFRRSPQEVRQACGEPVIARLCSLGLPRRVLMMACVEHLKSLPDVWLREVVERLRAAFPMRVNEENRFLSWEEARELARLGFEIGAHTVNHPILLRLPLEEAEREMRASRETLEEKLGVRVAHFSYPNGDTSPELMALAGRCFEAAVTTEQRVCSRADGLLALPRLCAPLSVSELSFMLSRYDLQRGLLAARAATGSSGERGV
jgi:peptidoglycan/xylan/chitin deacetylase (PgdA/CDA1 family)